MIISIIIVFLIFIAIVRYWKDKPITAFCLALAVCFGVFALFNFASCEKIYFIKETETRTETVIEEERTLLNLQDTNQSKGKFVGLSFVGMGGAVGSEEQKLYYCFYEETPYGYKFNKISPEDMEIYINYIDDNEKPKIIKEYDQEKRIMTLKRKPSIWWSSISSYKQYHNLDIGDTVEENISASGYRQVLYVPQNSIVENYKIDME